MASKQRARVCTACQILKIKCELSHGEGQPPCARCHRLGKECIVAVPRRQKDRIADLEAKIEELSKLLASQNFQQPKEGQKSTTESAKKRKLSNDFKPEESLPEWTTITPPAEPSYVKRVQEYFRDQELPYRDDAEHILRIIDSKVSLVKQEEILNFYVDEIVPTNPFVPISTGKNLTQLRTTAPLVLLAVLAFPTMGMLSLHTQTELTEFTWAQFATTIITRGERSLEIVQALLLATFWARKPPGHKQPAIYQLMQLATSTSIDIGIAGPQPTNAAIHTSDMGFDRTSLESKRAWLSCFACSASMTILLRRQAVHNWSPYHEECLQSVYTSPDRLASDAYACQLIRAEEIRHRIAEELLLCDMTVVVDVSDPITRFKMQGLKQRIDTWASQASSDVESSLIAFWQHLMMIHLNEMVLHTPSNKVSFSAPFFPDRLGLQDFAAPVVTPDSISCLYALKDACQGVLDASARFSIAQLRAASPLIYGPRILFALYILCKIQIALTAPGSTFCAVMNESELHLEYYFGKLRLIGDALEKIDATAFQSKLITATSFLEEWYLDRRRASFIPDPYVDVAAAADEVDQGDQAVVQQGPSMWDDLVLDGASEDFWFGNLFADPFVEDA